uniref:DUF4158 domain-containing protein n=1 Tax=Saccharopolyspora karakumensis TaxID=2530386 RepID=UPI0022A7D660|nr:DUF4158 domain-containing protein [Saccharopolyspora karakumensis]
MAVEFLSDDQGRAYGAFPESLPRGELERYFFLDDADRELVRGKRRPHNRLGFAIQLTSVRYLGRFMPDPRQVPVEVRVSGRAVGDLRSVVFEGLRRAGRNRAYPRRGDPGRRGLAGLHRGRQRTE